MRKGQAAIILLAIVGVGVIVFLLANPNFLGGGGGSSSLKYRNDVVTIENYFVSDKAPYTSTPSNEVRTTIQFEVRNNGDQKVPYLEIDFFDVSGFSIAKQGAELKLNCGHVGQQVGPKCIYAGDNALDPLDSRDIIVTLKSPEGIQSPTPYTVSFDVKYLYFGSRDFNIPVIDGTTKKQPSSKLRQSDASTGPVMLEIEPSIERTIKVGDETTSQHWAISGDNAFPFVTKFKFSHIGTVQGKIKDINITAGNVSIKTSGLGISGSCDFNKGTMSSFSVSIPGGSKYEVPNTQGYDFISAKSVVVPLNNLICTFIPNQKLAEYTATISAAFAYQYEYIMTQSFVVQPSPR